ncbi:eukaryotic translation initiation factor 3 subunit E, putative [Hepatocystis sp. ex Piliocolobus tephrosceles]|nr:eukaryotic translation initiation factor 3 subunit E, putative [Hepatocystis sp. ex Piliocolobus tephrosceles]
MDDIQNSICAEKDQSDLICKICSYLDPHMTQIILEWLKENKVLNDDEIENNLNIINEGCEKEIASIENEFTNGNRGVISNCLVSLSAEVEQFQEAMSLYKADCTNQMGANTIEKKNVMALREWCNTMNLNKNKTYTFSDNIDDQVLKLSRYYYQKKDYQKSKSYLLIYILNISEIIINISDSPKIKTCYWGIISNIINSYFINLNNEEYMFTINMDNKLVVKDEILNEVNVCIETIITLSQLLNKDKASKNEIMLQRSWLIHWALILIFHFFLYLIHVKNIYTKHSILSTFQEWFMDEKNITVLTIICPHIIRYYCVYAIFYRNRKEHFDLILNTLNILKYKYSDSFTMLLISIFIEYDFNMAQKCIANIGTICSKDVFLYKLKPYIEEQCRFIIFETYCRIHTSINIDMIADKVNLSKEDAEKWIVNLIRNAKLDAKIDSEKNCIQISTTMPNLYQKIIDKTQNLTMRSNFIVQMLNKPPTDETLQKTLKYKNKNTSNNNNNQNNKLKNTNRFKQFNSMYNMNKNMNNTRPYNININNNIQSDTHHKFNTNTNINAHAN